MLMVMPVMIRPPERAALHRRCAPEREQKLPESRGAVGLVGEVAVIDSRDGEHPQKIERDRGPHRHRADTDPKSPEAPSMQNKEGNAAHPIDLVGLVPHPVSPVGGMVSV